jgi:hypothetical protein
VDQWREVVYLPFGYQGAHTDYKRGQRQYRDLRLITGRNPDGFVYAATIRMVPVWIPDIQSLLIIVRC